jgi:DNA primase
MDIPEIKQQLSLAQVLEHYGLKPDKNDRLHCPFHPDKTPSLQIYPKTNTYCCFSSNCTAGTGDPVQFIQLMEKCNKHEALVKATALCGGSSTMCTSIPLRTVLNSMKEFKTTWLTTMRKRTIPPGKRPTNGTKTLSKKQPENPMKKDQILT